MEAKVRLTDRPTEFTPTPSFADAALTELEQRIWKGIRLYVERGIRARFAAPEGIGYLVPSESEDGRFYTVRYDAGRQWACTCRDHQRRKKLVCKHGICAELVHRRGPLGGEALVWTYHAYDRRVWGFDAGHWAHFQVRDERGFWKAESFRLFFDQTVVRDLGTVASWEIPHFASHVGCDVQVRGSQGVC